MPNIHTAEDIISLSDFKANASKMIKKAAETHRPIIITQNGRAAGVLLSPAEYDELTYRMKVVAAVEEGLRDTAEGKVIANEDLMGIIDESLLV